MMLFPTLDGFEPTRQTLHLYSQAVGAVPRAYGIAHPKWWHISLKVRPDGLVTDSVPLPNGGILALRLDLRQHQIVLETSQGDVRSFSMTAGLTSTDMGEIIVTAVAEFGLAGEIDRAKFANDEPRPYDPNQAQRYFGLLVEIDRIFKTHKAALKGETGPVQVWPHGFDLAFEWFGSRSVTHKEQGKVQEFPSQINLGFYPGNAHTAPYFYSNPFPFEADALLDKPLPDDVRWHTEGWQGTWLPYAALVNDANAEKKLMTYARAVYELASPLLA